MDDDFEDLLNDTGDPDLILSSPDPEKTPVLPVPLPDDVPSSSAPAPVASAARPSSRAERWKEMDIDLNAVPSENELRLAKRVAELEKERDDLAAELTTIKSRYPSHHPTIPIPIPKATTSTPTEPITVPSPLLPVLAVLRAHIAELTRDNQALRYTFLGPNPPSRGTIKPAQTPFVPSPLGVPSAVVGGPSATADAGANSSAGIASIGVSLSGTASAPSPAPLTATSAQVQDVDMTAQSTAPPVPAESTHLNPGIAQIDLEKVLDRVKDLILENEELGEMVLEAGRNEGGQEWEKALEESRAVIASLDADLTHHLSVVQSVQKELGAYKAHFGTYSPSAPLPASAASASASASAPAHTKTPTSSELGATPPPAPRGMGIRGLAGGRPVPVPAQSSGIPSGPRASQSGRNGSNSGSGHQLDRRTNDRPRGIGNGNGTGNRNGARYSSPIARGGRGTNGAAGGGSGGTLTPTSTGGSGKSDERGYKRRR